MLRFLSALLGLALFAAVVAVGLLLITRADSPLVTAAPTPSGVEARWIRDLVDGGAADSGDADGSRELDLSPRRIDILADLVAQRVGGGHARVLLDDGTAQVLATFPIPWERGGYANLSLQLQQTDGVPRVMEAAIGGVSVPAAAVQRLAQRGLDSLAWSDRLERVRFRRDGARLTYRWSHEGLDAVAADLLSDPDRRRLLLYQAQLAEILGAGSAEGQIDLAILLSELLAGGDDASAPSADAMADNRAALFVLAAYVNGRDRGLTRGADGALPRPGMVQLQGRHDLAQHFLASAAMAAEGGAALSHLVGLAKELRDADGGSGFSFQDLTANRAGMRFAEVATGSAEGARHVQRLARAGLDQDSIMPAVDGLPEGMQRVALERAIGDVGSSEYRRVVDYIDQRIDNTRLHRGAPSG
ncbi:MAG: hypothetical protein WBG92_07895 [Thiohalocapsa sp.]